MSELAPTYLSTFLAYIDNVGLERLFYEVPWKRATEARAEAFMAPTPVAYTYGKGKGERTYASGPFCAGVDVALKLVNAELAIRGWGPLNVCFLNRYDNERDHLGWHADDHEGTDHTRPIAVVSFGAAREIWWRPNGATGEAPADCRQLLSNRSLFIMPPGFQSTHQHRIPKADRVCGPRVSLTFRAFLGVP